MENIKHNQTRYKKFKKAQKKYVFLHKKIDINTDFLRRKEYNNKNINYYYLPKLDYDDLNTFNQPDNCLNVFHI